MRHGPAAWLPGNSWMPGRRRNLQAAGRCQPAARPWTDIQLCHLCSDCCQISPGVCVLWLNVCREDTFSAYALLEKVHGTAPYLYIPQACFQYVLRTHPHLELSQSQQQPWRSPADSQMQHLAQHMHRHCLHPAEELGHTPAALCPGPHSAWHAARQAVSCRLECALIDIITL